jgi:hypothetical protein
MAASCQAALFCPCGARPAVGGLCRCCYAARWRSSRRFGGRRERVLARDGGRCRVCGSAARLCVHHRRPGRHDSRSLITVCRACHACLHHRNQVPGQAPPLLTILWREQHRGWPLQLSLALWQSVAVAAA